MHSDSFGLTRRTLIGAAATAPFALSSAGTAQTPQPVAARTARPGQVPVAYLVDDSITLIDFVGPLEAFEDAPQADVPGFFGYTVGRTHGPFTSQSGLLINAEFTLDDAPLPKVLVIAAQRHFTPEKLDWIRRVHAQADVVMSVCTGAFLLAQTGLLDGQEATTHHEFYDRFASSFPNVRVVRDRRFVDNGKIITTGGLTSGIEGALRIITRYYGEEAAQITADYMEHRRGPWRG